MNKLSTLNSEIYPYQEEPLDIAYSHYVDETIGGREEGRGESENRDERRVMITPQG
jgi:hypothetical protein